MPPSLVRRLSTAEDFLIAEAYYKFKREYDGACPVGRYMPMDETIAFWENEEREGRGRV